MSVCVDFAGCVPLVKDVVLTIGAVVAIWAAIQGLSTWRRQLKGGVEYELARRLLKRTYLMRDAIRSVRNPIMLPEESKLPADKEGKELTMDERSYYGVAAGYQRRWDPVLAVGADMSADIVEAEVLWPEVKQKFELLRTLQGELGREIRYYLAEINPKLSKDRQDSMFKLRTKSRSVMYDMSTEEELDDFSEDIAMVIRHIEDFLRRHLRK